MKNSLTYPSEPPAKKSFPLAKAITLFLPFLLLSILLPQTTLANGGPVDIGHLRKTGNIRLMKNADVTLLKENLNIKVVGDSTEIEVEYHLRNNGEAQQIHYGFPVDAYDEGFHYGECAWPVFHPYNDFVEYFQIFTNGQESKVVHWVVDSVYVAESVNLNEGFYRSKEKYSILRRWYTTSLHFDKGEVKELKVLYKVKNTMRDKGPGFSFVYRFTDRHFTYDLSPSSNWGDGIVKEFNLKIDLAILDSTGADYTVTGIENLIRDHHNFTYSATEYDLKQKDRIDIHYNNSHIKMAAFIQKYELPTGIVKSISSSSNSSTVNNLLDHSPQTTWTGKQGDWIEIQFHKIPRKSDNRNIMPDGILALNGDYSSDSSFAKSGKMEYLKVIVNDSIVFNTEPWDREKGKRIIHLDKPVFRNVSPSQVQGLATIIADGYALKPHPVDFIYKIRIEILAVDGNAGKEVTLSDLYFVGYLGRP